MTKRATRHLTKAMTNLLSQADALEIAYRELLALRERVREEAPVADDKNRRARRARNQSSSPKTKAKSR